MFKINQLSSEDATLRLEWTTQLFHRVNWKPDPVRYWAITDFPENHAVYDGQTDFAQTDFLSSDYDSIQ